MKDASKTAPAPRTGTRERILDAACRRFARGGRDAVSMRDLAAETQLTMPTLYHHFGDKGALYDACIAHVIEGVQGQLRQALHTAGTPPDRLRRFTEVLCRHLLGHPALLAFLQMESVYGHDPLLRLVPQDLRDDIESMSDARMAAQSLPLGAACRLVAVAFGYAVMARARPDHAGPTPDPAVLADRLLGASRVAASGT